MAPTRTSVTAVSKRGVTLHGRVAQVYLNQCPEDNPCSEDDHLRLKARLDGDPLPERRLNAGPPGAPGPPGSPADPAAPTVGNGVVLEIANGQAVYRRVGTADVVPAEVPTNPSLLRKAGNLVRDSLTHLLDAGRKVPPEVYDARLAVCRECPLYRDNHCTHRNCGCQLASESRMTGALWWASKQCPDSPPRWGRYDGSTSPGVALPVVKEDPGGPA